MVVAAIDPSLKIRGEWNMEGEEKRGKRGKKTVTNMN